MPKENIGYNPNKFTGMPEVRGQSLIEARILPRLNKADSMLAHATAGQTEFLAQVLS